MGGKFVQIVMFGDSMTWSSRAPYGKRYADYLECNIQNHLEQEWVVDVAVCGNGGNTAAEGLERIDRDVIEYSPDIVIVNFGGNDAIRAPSKNAFETSYRNVLDIIKGKTSAAIILETIPTLDEQWHSHRDNENAVKYGGIENYLEYFSHSYIREMAKEYNVPLHDRFKIYHQALGKDRSIREACIRTDGVHLTCEGNRYFAEILTRIAIDFLPKLQKKVPGDPPSWLTKALANPAYQSCSKAFEDDKLKQVLLAGDDIPHRLLLQQCRSFSRRAMTCSDDIKDTEKAADTQLLATGFLAALRIINQKNPEVTEGCINWWQKMLKQQKHKPGPGTEKITTLLPELLDSTDS